LFISPLHSSEQGPTEAETEYSKNTQC
jgi:hypothetical protein